MAGRQMHDSTNLSADEQENANTISYSTCRLLSQAAPLADSHCTIAGDRDGGRCSGLHTTLQSNGNWTALLHVWAGDGDSVRGRDDVLSEALAHNLLLLLLLLLLLWLHHPSLRHLLQTLLLLLLLLLLLSLLLFFLNSLFSNIFWFFPLRQISARMVVVQFSILGACVCLPAGRTGLGGLVVFKGSQWLKWRNLHVILHSHVRRWRGGMSHAQPSWRRTRKAIVRRGG